MPTEAARENFDTFFVKPSVALGGLVSDWFACGATRKDGKPNVSEEAMDEGVTIDLDDLANQVQRRSQTRPTILRPPTRCSNHSLTPPPYLRNLQPMTPELAQTKVETPNGLQFGASSDEITPNGGIKLPSAQIGDEIGAEVSAENSAAAANTIASALAQALPKETPSATPQATPPTTPVKPATPPPPPKPKVVCPDKRASKAIPPPDPDPPLSAFAGSWKKEIGEGGHAAFVQEMGVPWLIARTFAGSPPNNHFRVVDGHLE